MLSIDYVAAFIDGEGTVTMLCNKRGPRTSVMINNTNRGIMIELSLTFDLWDIKHSMYCLERRKSNHKVLYRISVDNMDSVHKLLSYLYSSLRIKREQASILIDYINQRRNEGSVRSNAFMNFAADCVMKIRALNKTGV